VVDDLETVADKDEPNGASSGLEVSTNRSGTTSERRVTRASARSQQQRGRSSADGMLHMLCVTVVAQFTSLLCNCSSSISYTDCFFGTASELISFLIISFLTVVSF